MDCPVISQSYDHPEISEHDDAFELPVTEPTGEDLDNEMTQHLYLFAGFNPSEKYDIISWDYISFPTERKNPPNVRKQKIRYE